MWWGSSCERCLQSTAITVCAHSTNASTSVTYTTSVVPSWSNFFVVPAADVPKAERWFDAFRLSLEQLGQVIAHAVDVAAWRVQERFPPAQRRARKRRRFIQQLRAA